MKRCREACIEVLEQGTEPASDAAILGWREIKTDSSTIGRNARSAEPHVMQIFVGLGDVEPHRFDLMLYLARKRAENAIRDGKLAG